MSQNVDNRGNAPQKHDRIGLILYAAYLLLLGAAVLIFLRIVDIQIFFRPAPKIENALTPKVEVRTLEPVRGNILDHKGRLLAMSYPVYDLHMDCTVQKAHFAKMGAQKAAEREQAWLEKARELSEGLAGFFPEKSAQKHFEQIREGRRAGQKYLRIGRPVDHKTLLRIKQLPLFREGANRGGLIVEQRNVRRYPYGELARRTIGFVRDNRGTDITNTHIGLEGKYDFFLHGKDGRESLRVTDYGMVRDFDSSYVKAVDGKDLVTTLDIDLQDVADKALRAQISEEEDLMGACLVLMEVQTGAIRAMVNLYRDANRENRFEEVTNLAISQKREPGSVFKTVTLMTVLSDGIVKSLDETIPTRHGVVPGTNPPLRDVHISDFEREHKTDRISVLDGFKISSNYVFGNLAVEHYGQSEEKTRQFIEKIYSYKLGEPFDFDLDGLATPFIASPDNRYWTKRELGQIGFGYNTEETPLHILTFYNAIANKGRMMKPYLVERLGKEERVPSVLNAAICTPAVADTITRALLAVTQDGTGKALKKAACPVAGKTGTAFGTINGEYKDPSGRRNYLGTFAGFFPAENPQYSIICCVYSSPTHRSYQGGGIPARVVRTVVDHICHTDPFWQGSLQTNEPLPVMKAEFEPLGQDDSATTLVPDLNGLGLKDALFQAERLGLNVSYEGSGHVRSQSPRAGATVNKGTTVKIELK